MPANEFWWQGVSDHLGDCKFSFCEGEEIASWEALDHCGLPEGNSAILRRMKKSSLGWVHTSACDGWANLIPTHSAVHIFKPIALIVAIKRKARRKLGATSTIFGNPFNKVCNPWCALFPGAVQGIRPRRGRVHQIKDGLSNGPALLCGRAERWCRLASR